MNPLRAVSQYPANPRSFRLGRARVGITNTGDITLPLAPVMRAPAGGSNTAAGQAAVDKALLAHRVMPMQGTVIQHAEITTVVDSGVYDIGRGSPYFLDGYTPPPPQLVQLSSMGIQATDVRHVVITHSHFDHYSGTTVPGRGGFVPAFPNAQYYLGERDWAAVEAKFSDPDSLQSRTFAVLARLGRLRRVSEAVGIAPGVTIVPSPGETAGHQVVHLRSAGESFISAGDLYHHPIEVEHPGWMVNWADAETNARSRRSINELAASERAVMLLSHVREPGRILRQAAGLRWEPVAIP